MPPDPRVKAGVAAWITDGENLLMIHRWNPNPEHPAAGDGHNTWSVPGGWIEFGDDHLRTAEKETLEEVGIEVDALGSIGVTVGQNDDNTLTIVCIFVQCELRYPQTPRNMEPDKCDAVAWKPLVDLRDRKLPLFHNIERFLDDPLTAVLADLDRWS